jgi:hypothetical protein
VVAVDQPPIEEDAPMADQSPDPDSGGEPRVGPDGGTHTPTPRWVKVLGIIIVVLLLLVGIMVLIGGEHGPGRHAPPASEATQPTAGDHD